MHLDWHMHIQISPRSAMDMLYLTLSKHPRQECEYHCFIHVRYLNWCTCKVRLGSCTRHVLQRAAWTSHRGAQMQSFLSHYVVVITRDGFPRVACKLHSGFNRELRLCDCGFCCLAFELTSHHYKLLTVWPVPNVGGKSRNDDRG